MEFVLLREVAARVDGNPVPLGERQHRLFVAILLLAESDRLSTGTLIERIWGHRPPETARILLERIAKKVRRALADAEPGAGDLLPRGAGGYRLQVPRGQVDSLRFRDRRDQARELARTDPTTALDLLRDALTEWGAVVGKGDPQPLVGVEGDWIDGIRLTLVKEHRAARIERARLEIEVGEPSLAIGELEALSALVPTNERIAELLMRAYYMDGRRTDALAIFPRMARLLRSQHGKEPDESLRELNQRVVADDKSLRRPFVTYEGPKIVVPYNSEQARRQEPVARLFLAIDTEEPGRLDDVASRRACEDIRAIFDQAMSACGITPGQVVLVDGFCFMALIDVEPLSILDRGLDALGAALAVRNQHFPGVDRLRLRVAVHHGQTHREGQRWLGSDLTAAFRLVATDQLTQVLRRAKEAQCVIAVSAALYESVIRHGHEDLNAGTYGQLDNKTGWVRVPGRPHAPLHDEPNTAEHGGSGTPVGHTVYGNLFDRNNIEYVDASIRLPWERRP